MKQEQHHYIHNLQTTPLFTSKNFNKITPLPQKRKTLLQINPRFSGVVSRSAMIVPQHVNRVFLVHNGKTYNSVAILPKMLGHKFGEFASTRKIPLHKKKKTKK